MKHLIVLASLVLTACGSSSGGGQSGLSGNVSATGKRVLFITDIKSGSFTSDIRSGFPDGADIQYVDSYTNYQTLDGSNLQGAAEQVSGWLSTTHYDAVVFSIGTTEYQHDLQTNPYFHQFPSYREAHAKTFLNALRSSPGVPQLLIYISPYGPGGSAELVNHAGQYGLVAIDDAFGYTGDYQALVSVITSKLAQALD